MTAKDAMADEQSRDYLAARVLTESQPVTYRLLSRALQVHVNVAKRSVKSLHVLYVLNSPRLLFEFHQKQNARKPNSVHATYLVAGTKRKSESTKKLHDHDTDMRSSPFMSSMPEKEESDSESDSDEEVAEETVIVLVREEELEGQWYVQDLVSPKLIAGQTSAPSSSPSHQFISTVWNLVRCRYGAGHAIIIVGHGLRMTGLECAIHMQSREKHTIPKRKPFGAMEDIRFDPKSLYKGTYVTVVSSQQMLTNLVAQDSKIHSSGNHCLLQGCGETYC